MARLAFDSCFLIDLERERAGRKTAFSALRFLRQNSAVELTISPVALGEFAVGFADQSNPALAAVLESFALLPSSPAVSLAYSRIYRHLAQDKLLIGSNDMWIAAYSIAAGIALVTSNTREFARIDGLTLLGY